MVILFSIVVLAVWFEVKYQRYASILDAQWRAVPITSLVVNFVDRKAEGLTPLFDVYGEIAVDGVRYGISTVAALPSASQQSVLDWVDLRDEKEQFAYVVDDHPGVVSLLQKSAYSKLRLSFVARALWLLCAGYAAMQLGIIG